MDWIERTTGISPDGSSGSLELLIYLVLLAIAVLLLRRAMQRDRDRS